MRFTMRMGNWVSGLLIVVAALLLGLPVARAAGAEAGHVQVSLVADAAAVEAGKTVRVGVLLKIDPGWHVYWVNPGDSGMATWVKLETPPGFAVGAVQYPIPMRIDLPGDIVNNIYENEVMLMVPVTAATDLSGGTDVEFTANVSWLVCKDVCIPGKAVVQMRLPVSIGGASAANLELFDRWTGQLPKAADEGRIAKVVGSCSFESGDHATGTARASVDWKQVPPDLQWFVEPVSGYELGTPIVKTEGGRTSVEVKLSSPSGAKPPETINSVLTYKRGDERWAGVKIEIRNPAR